MTPSTPSGAWLSVSSDTLACCPWLTAPAPAAAAWTSVSPPLWCQTFAITVVSPVAPHADTISTPW